jgi:N-acetylglucosaminyldiphosphoundecaprenol N-acetyl-beta-D-mannosaminyltransferase
VTRVVEVFRHRYPGLCVAGWRNGYFRRREEPSIARRIRESRADMLFAGFPSPAKEKFLKRWIPVMRVPFCMGVGGSFDVVAGVRKRAPAWMQRWGLEWGYRILQEPGRMAARYLRTNPVFLWMVMAAWLGRKNTG